VVRRTKEEALATRNRLLDAAEHLFQAQGVSRTSLQDIARRAGATRGAIYWHFKDKADLFNAMMERVTLPMEASFRPEQADADAFDNGDANALHQIRCATLQALQQIATDAQTRRVFEVATQKVEYVEELQAVRLRHLKVCNGFLSRIEQSMNAASLQTGLPLPLCAAAAARGLHALIDGLIQNWLLDPEAFDLLEVGQGAINVYLRGLGFANEACSAHPSGSAAESD
jgi:TetR/AcrR family transcriptional regulator, acrAB operon repressor